MLTFKEFWTWVFVSWKTCKNTGVKCSLWQCYWFARTMLKEAEALKKNEEFQNLMKELGQ